ncbi:metalloregulator ArsR/SmtB family transcription factor [Thalassotalea sp. LPB0316]|uniref:metalloregulator ArsR/SmtB family transcription factor n=1 Tax=Thalassotalea sp. LPB0316 TaxID=2769490 RepID=UPI001866AC37|nr:metalloregulator ArsR/SmtB family transcription factor [Thalassotalea sp. LPB0316]QOL25187.1 metalloregulator ArsR/SmtB family transcription factor [Thalassotalea sp. LPB0316]
MKVLFLCTENSARSLMAEAMLRHHAHGQVEVYSAGTQPNSPSPIALSLLAELNVEHDFLYSKSIETVNTVDFDLVVTLCESAAHECQQLSHGKNYQHWAIADPKTENTKASFAQALNQINRHIQVLLAEVGDFNKFTITPKQFYQCLADDIRLQSLLLIILEGELCVCELMTALAQDSQPKVSRHLAQLKKQGLLVDRKHQQWVFYRLNATLPSWMKLTLTNTLIHQPDYTAESIERLKAMRERPNKGLVC